MREISASASPAWVCGQTQKAPSISEWSLYFMRNDRGPRRAPVLRVAGWDDLLSHTLSRTVPGSPDTRGVRAGGVEG